MTPLQENKLLKAILTAIAKGKGRKAVSIASKVSKSAGKDIQDVLGLLGQIQKNFDDIEKKEPGLTTKFKL